MLTVALTEYGKSIYATGYIGQTLYLQLKFSSIGTGILIAQSIINCISILSYNTREKNLYKTDLTRDSAISGISKIDETTFILKIKSDNYFRLGEILKLNYNKVNAVTLIVTESTEEVYNSGTII